jgi:hypothetical protein
MDLKITVAANTLKIGLICEDSKVGNVKVEALAGRELTRRRLATKV